MVAHTTLNFTPLGWDRPPTVPVTNRHNTSPRRGSQGLVQRSATHTSTVSVDYAQQASRGGGAGTAALLMEAAESRTRPARPATESRTRPARPASGTTARALLGFSMLPLPFSEMKTETLPPVTNPANRNVPRVLVRVNSRDSLGHDAAQSKSHIVRTEATRSALYGSSRKSEAVQSTGSRTHREVSTQHMYKRSQDVPPPPPPLPWEPTAARSPRAVADMPDASIIGQGKRIARVQTARNDKRSLGVQMFDAMVEQLSGQPNPWSTSAHGVDQRLPRKSAPRPANIPKPRNVTLGGGKLVPNVDAEQDAKASPTLETSKAPLAAKSTSTSPASSRPPSGRNISSARKFERHIRTPSEVPIVAVGRPASSHTSRPSVDVPSLRDPIRGILNRRAAQPEPFRRCEDAASGDLRHPRFGGKLVSKSKSQQNNRGDVDLQRGSQSERPANVWDDFADVCGWETDQVVSDMF